MGVTKERVGQTLLRPVRGVLHRRRFEVVWTRCFRCAQQGLIIFVSANQVPQMGLLYPPLGPNILAVGVPLR